MADELSFSRTAKTRTNASTSIAANMSICRTAACRTAIVTSRLPRLIDANSEWLGGLRAALRQVRERGDTLMLVDGTAGSNLIQRGADRLGLAIEKIAVTSDAANPSFSDETEVDLPPQDSVLFRTADLVIALEVRTNGNIHRGLRLRGQRGEQVTLVDLPGLQSRAVRDELQQLGATLWKPEPVELWPLNGAATIEATIAGTICEVAALPSRSDWIYLTHTTRACSGPWPGQATDDYLDSLLDNSHDADHSTAATLGRIVNQRCLIASSDMIRGGYAMVCFTAVPLVDLPAIRQFRQHRTRWDFEPYGLCIRRQWLQDRGARSVIYGDEACWQGLADVDQPYFQFTSQSGLDWTIEQEWRHPGDLDLRELTDDDALLFVPRHADVLRLAPYSPWPVTMWPGSETIKRVTSTEER